MVFSLSFILLAGLAIFIVALILVMVIVTNRNKD